MNVRILILSAIGLMLLMLASACGSPDLPAPTPAATPTATPFASETPTAVRPPSSKEPESAPTPLPKGFFSAEDLFSAYPGGNDQSFTPYTMYKGAGDYPDRFSQLPRVVMGLFDKDGELLMTFGSGSEALLVDKYAVTSSVVSTAPAPPPQFLPPDVDRENVSVGAILEFGLRPDGSRDYEVLKRSIAKGKNPVFLEIFERSPNPDHPFPKKFAFETQSLAELEARDRLVFHAYTGGISGEYTKTTKRASISAIYPDAYIIAMNGSVTPGDAGALVFSSLGCGKQRLVGMTLGSPLNRGKENEPSVLGIEKVFEFISENTAIALEISKGDSDCPQTDAVLNTRAKNAISDGLYDFSYDLCYLKGEACIQNELAEMVRPIETVQVWKEIVSEGFVQERVIDSGIATLIGRHVFVPSSVFSRSALHKDPRSSTEFKHRIVWGDKEYEYIEFVAFDSSGDWAAFKRPDDTKFPVGEGLPFVEGKSADLELGNVLYTLGAVDFNIFDPDDFNPLLRRAIDPASLIGRSPEQDDRFHLQGSGRDEDIGAPVCALMDGECEVVGFVFSDFDDPKDEVLSTALTVESMLGAVEEIACANEIVELCVARPKRAPNVHFRTVEAIADRDMITHLLVGSSDAPPLLTDIVRPDLSVLSEYEGQLLIILVDETGAIVKGSGAMYREAAILSNEYVLTSSAAFSLPLMLNLRGEDAVVDVSDITSNVIVSDGEKMLEVKVALIYDFLDEREALSLFEDIPFLKEALRNISDPDFLSQMDADELIRFTSRIRTILHRNGESELIARIDGIMEIWSAEQSRVVRAKLAGNLQRLLGEPPLVNVFRQIVRRMEILEVKRISRESGWALLARPVPPVRPTPDISERLGIAELKPDKEIFIAYSGNLLIFEGSLTELDLISPGTSTYARPESPAFIFNGFVSGRNLGSIIYTMCGGKFCLLGIVAQASQIPDKVQTEGFGLPFSFIFKDIKEKEGIDLFPKHEKE